MIADVKKSAEQKMQKSLEALKADLGKVRTGRAHTGLLDHITVDYYGTQTPLNQVATLSLPDARTIAVTPYEKRMAGVIEKAIRDSDLGLNPASQSGVIRVPLPALNEQRRKELAKVLHKLAEEGRVAVRHARTDAREKLKKLEHVGKDDVQHAEKDLQKVHDEYMTKIDELLKHKEAEVMEV